jgi:hypothetical protein
MKNLITFTFSLIFLAATSQTEENKSYSVFNPKNMKREYFITTNSGVFSTPIGLKIGYISNPGLYVGFRHGIGKVYNSDSDFTTNATGLFSITAGINKPLIIKKDFKLVAQLGAGYGQWYKFRWERWVKSGYEIEAGLMIQKKNFLFQASGNFLDAGRTYATGDLTLGIGYTLNTCK